jgi:hypothetical protein
MDAQITYEHMEDGTGKYLRARMLVENLEHPLTGAWMRTEEGALKELAYALGQQNNIRYLAVLVEK